jgi:hypothetical protein
MAMVAYREPDFQDHCSAAAKARGNAPPLPLKAKPPLDPDIVAERVAHEQKREADQLLRAAQKAEERAAQARVAVVTEADLKAARDACHAARKARKI